MSFDAQITKVEICEEDTHSLIGAVELVDEGVVKVTLTDDALFTDESWREFSELALSQVKMIVGTRGAA